MAKTLVALVLVAAGGCASTGYQPTVVARGELTLRYDGGFIMDAGGREVSHGLTWPGLPHHVRCVPQAYERAEQAQSRGGAAIVTSILGGGLGAIALGGFYGLSDTKNAAAWLGGGVAVATVGLVFAIVSQALKNSANGHAVDAMNSYNDAVGSLGATCDDLTYPPPAGPVTEPQPVEAHPTGTEP